MITIVGAMYSRLYWLMFYLHETMECQARYQERQSGLNDTREQKSSEFMLQKVFIGTADK